MKELPMFTYNLWIGCLHPRYIMSITLSSYQHCDEQQFPTLSCALCTIFPVIKLLVDLVIQALLLDYVHSCSGKKYVYALRASCFYIEINTFEHF